MSTAPSSQKKQSVNSITVLISSISKDTNRSAVQFLCSHYPLNWSIQWPAVFEQYSCVVETDVQRAFWCWGAIMFPIKWGTIYSYTVCFCARQTASEAAWLAPTCDHRGEGSGCPVRPCSAVENVSENFRQQIWHEYGHWGTFWGQCIGVAIHEALGHVPPPTRLAFQLFTFSGHFRAAKKA